MKRTFTKRFNNVLAAVLTVVALAAGQSAMAETKTYTISGSTENGTVTLNIAASGSNLGHTSWDFAEDTSASLSLGNIILSFGSDKTSSMAVQSDVLQIEAISSKGGYIKLEYSTGSGIHFNNTSIYHITLKDKNDAIIIEAWNRSDSYTYKFQSIAV